MNKLIAIAVNQYSDKQISDLNNCINDVNAIIGICTNRYQFEVTELYSSKETTTLSSLYNNLYDQFINALEGDSILIYFAGHGEYNQQLGASYWMCSDSLKSNVTSWFNINIINAFFKASKATNIALISDTCFSGAIFETSRGGGSYALDGKISRQALTSGGIEKVSDGSGEHSHFNLCLAKVLNENNKPTLSFYELSEKVILEFDENATQTPCYGPLIESGHMGGTFMLNLQEVGNNNNIKDIQLSLELPKEIIITSDIKIPFFNRNNKFYNDYINTFVQSLGYTIINDLRNYIFMDLSHAIERSKIFGFQVDVNYSVEYFDEKYLSIKFNHYSEMGGMHPNYYVYTINFAFLPDRKISIYDILDLNDHQDLKGLLNTMIQLHAHSEDRNFLKQCLEDSNFHDLPFSFTKEELTIHWFNDLPHAFKAHGQLSIPIKSIDKSREKINLG